MTEVWRDICSTSDIAENTGVAAKFMEHQVAIFNLQPENVFKSVSNYDPIAKANIISRGIVGELNGKRLVASPLYKQHFCLDTGVCLEKDDVRLTTFETRVLHGKVQLKIN